MSSEPADTTRRPRVLLLLAGLLALVGSGLSTHLAWVHYKLYTDASYAPGCDFNQTVSCSFVEMSPYAVSLGLPVALWGLLGYLVLLGVVVSGGIAAPRSGWPRGALVGLGALFTLVSVYNAAISVFVLEKICPYCVGTYAVNAALLGLGLVATVGHGPGVVGSVVSDLRVLAQRARATAVAAGAFVLVSALLLIFLPPYWKTASAGHGGAGNLGTGQLEDGAHWIGASNPAVTIVEFSDYECPYCARSHDVVREAVLAQPDRLRLVHRHYPLDMACNEELDRPFHRYACLAAEAAECAGEQGKFWEMNDRLFMLQKQLGESTIDRLVDELSLDRPRFDTCVGGARVLAHLRADVARGVAYQATGTPFYEINGTLHKGAMTPEKLAQMIARSGFGGGVAPATRVP
ncbi:MAG: vitamin K epoxide reductase family protein [Pseudomonadota bacterium]